MNEIIMNTSSELGQSLLGKITNRINAFTNAGIKSEKERARLISKVVTEEMYVKGGFKTVADWSEKYIGVNKSTVSRINKAVITFAENPEIWDNYTLSQMFEMVNASDDTISKITPDMSAKAIRALVKSEKDMVDVKSTETNSCAGETENAENAENAENGKTEDNAELALINRALDDAKRLMLLGKSVNIEKTENGWKITEVR